MNLQELIDFHARLVNLSEHAPGSMHRLHKEAVELLTSLLPPASAQIESLPGRPWNAHAVLHDVLNEISMETPIMVMWLDKEEVTRHRAACTNMQAVWLLHNQLHKY